LRIKSPERFDLHLGQAVARTHRQFEIRDRRTQDLHALVFLALAILVVEHVLAGQRIAQVKARARVARILLENRLVARHGQVVFAFVFVNRAQVDQHVHGHGADLHNAFVGQPRRVVVAGNLRNLAKNRVQAAVRWIGVRDVLNFLNRISKAPLTQQQLTARGYDVEVVSVLERLERLFGVFQLALLELAAEQGQARLERLVLGELRREQLLGARIKAGFIQRATQEVLAEIVAGLGFKHLQRALHLTQEVQQHTLALARSSPGTQRFFRVPLEPGIQEELRAQLNQGFDIRRLTFNKFGENITRGGGHPVKLRGRANLESPRKTRA
jgi:hypothetical protein